MHIQQRHCLPLLKFPNSILTFPRHVLQYVTCGNFKCPAGGQPSCFPRPEATIEHRILENWTGRVGQPFPLAAPSGHLRCARVQFTSFPTLSHCRQDSEWISCCVKQLMAMSSPAPFPVSRVGRRAPPSALWLNLLPVSSALPRPFFFKLLLLLYPGPLQSTGSQRVLPDLATE